MPKNSVERRASELYPNDSIIGEKIRLLRERAAKRFQLWRISVVVDMLPTAFDVNNYGETTMVKGEKQGLHTIIAVTEQLLDEGADVVRTTDITIDREVKKPHRVIALEAQCEVTNEVAEIQGIAPITKHFMLDGAANTMPLSEVAAQIQLANRVVENAQRAELIASGKIPAVPTPFP